MEQNENKDVIIEISSMEYKNAKPYENKQKSNSQSQNNTDKKER